MSTMGIDENAPVISREEILIDAPLGTIWGLHTDISSWSEWLPDIDASEIEPPRRIVWSGPAQSIMAIHLWTMTPSENGVLVHTEESWDGEPVRAQPEEMQRALDDSLRGWLQNLKHKAEMQAQGR